MTPTLYLMPHWYEKNKVKKIIEEKTGFLHTVAGNSTHQIPDQVGKHTNNSITKKSTT